MPRKLKPYKVDQVKDGRTGVEVEIFFDREEKNFFGEVGGTEHRSKDLDETKRQVRAALEGWRGYEWRTIIEVEFSGERLRDYGWNRDAWLRAGMSLAFRRREVADTLDPDRKVWRPVLIDGIDDEDRIAWPINPDEAPEYDPDDRDYRPKTWAKRRKEELDKIQKRALRRRESGEDIETWHPQDGDLILPFTEERWEALMALRAMLIEAAEKIAKITETGDALAIALDKRAVLRLVSGQ